MSLRVAIVGCGKIADGHVEEIQKMPARAQVVAVCDLELLMAEQLAVRYKIPRHYDDMDRMLDAEKPDVVHITTPPQSHLALAVRAMDAGCHVYVEKPLTLNYQDSRKLVDHAVQSNKKLTIGYTNYFDPPAIAMREMVSGGVIGDPVHVESFYGYKLAGPFGAALLGDGSHWVHKLPGKLFHNTIDHMLYKITEFIDDEKPCIKALAYSLREGRFGDERDDVQDELRVMIQGSRVSAYGTFSGHIHPAAHFVRVCGTKNTLHIDYVSRTVILEPDARLPSAIGRLLPAFGQARRYLRAGMKNTMRFARSDFHFFAGLNNLIAAYYDSILNDTAVPISYRDILRISAMLDEIFAQIDPGAHLK